MYEKLINLLEEKEKLVDKFLELTNLQQEYILNDNFDELSEIVDKKAKLIERINILDDEFIKEFEGIKKAKNIKSFDEITDIDKETGILLKSLTSSIMEKLKVIKEIDEKNSILIRAKFDEVKRTIKTLRYKKEAIKDYTSYKQIDYHSGFDKKE
ncbi:flagellar protein FlgN [Caldicellulosiruptor naganoensis]|uniref:Flagellar protein FlgN n=1 Tax=Caldicellulosiruptor naganoensis TaxID=29324 RepID=A0ABY7BG09_9FIRM|nr:flagellar protein FlgN [Caldicellulosiruptor naganoensis]WAM30827.1 flagellar protein FlgN [Caldicellulosiruptor naganoensis]